jgi:small subunit ribosomal protein S20
VANTPQARKRARQNDKRRTHNASLRSLVRTKIKQVIAAADTGNADDARAAYDSAVPVIDRMANRGIIKKTAAQGPISLIRRDTEPAPLQSLW